jgi:hypothetical protein
MRIPRAGWWILAPLSWVWQYGAYVPSHLLWNLLNILIGLGDAKGGHDRTSSKAPTMVHRASALVQRRLTDASVA